MKNHFNMVVRAPEYPEVPSIHIGARPASTDRQTKTPVTVNAAAAAPSASDGKKETTGTVGEKQSPPAVVAAQPEVKPVEAKVQCNQKAEAEAEAAAIAMEKEIQQSMDHMHRMAAHSYNKQRNHNHQSAVEHLPEAMSLTYDNRPNQPNPKSHAKPAADVETAPVLPNMHIQHPLRENRPSGDEPVVRGSFDHIPPDVEFVHLNAEKIASRLQQNGRMSTNAHKEPKVRQPNRFVEDFSDHAMHNVQHFADRRQPVRPSQKVPAFAAEETLQNGRPYANDDDTSIYRTINEQDEIELNANPAESETLLDYHPYADASGTSDQAGNSAADTAQNTQTAHHQDNLDEPTISSAAYKIPHKKVKPYTAPALHKPYRTTSTTTQRIPYMAPIKSQKPAQFYIIHETPTSTQRPYLAPTIYKGYSLDTEQRLREEQRLGDERDREERLQLEQERVQLEQQQRDQLEQHQQQQRREEQDKQQLREQYEQQQLREQHSRLRLLQHFDENAPPHAEYLRRTQRPTDGGTTLPTTTTVIASSTSPPATPAAPTTSHPARLSHPTNDILADRPRIIQHPTGAVSQTSGVQADDDVDVFVQASQTSDGYSQSYRYDKPAVHRRPVTRTRVPLSESQSSSGQKSAPKSTSNRVVGLPKATVSAFVAVPLDQRDERAGVQHQIPAHLARHQFVFDSKPPHAFLESPFRPHSRKNAGHAGGNGAGSSDGGFAFKR